MPSPNLSVASAPALVPSNGHANGVSRRSLLKRYEDDEIHDLVCVGFGPASLAIAVAMHDVLRDRQPGLRTQQPKIRFLEKQAQFRWHAGMILSGTKMQITFIKDLATLRNPRSEFTFLNYLHEKGRLVQFTNLGTFLPQRIEYEDYMKWCASWFEDVVDYSQDVRSVEAGPTLNGVVDHFQVVSRNWATGEFSTLKAKHVVIAAGGKPNIPKSLSLPHPRIIHSSQYATHVSELFPQGTAPQSVAVIGAGQSAAEVFDNIPSRFPEAKCHLLIRGSALRPSDDSPFVNEIFDPERVEDVYHQSPDVRARELHKDKGTNYSVVRLELLEHIYSMLYSYRIRYRSEEEWPQQILTHRTVTGVEPCKGHGLRLHIRNESGTYSAAKQSGNETLDVDLVVVASGYRRDAHEDMLRNIEHLRSTKSDRWTVTRDYGVEFADGKVQSDAGVWLQGCNEASHGLSDSLLSILAIRGGEMVNSIFKGAGSLADDL